MKAASVDLVRKLPNCLFRVRQRRQTIVGLALDFNALHIVGRAAAFVVAFKPVDAVGVLILPGFPRLLIWCISRSPPISFLLAELQHVGEKAQFGRQSEREAAA